MLEPRGLYRTDGKRPDGVTMIPWEIGKQLVWDVTVVDALGSSRLNQGGHGNKFERISSNFDFEWTKFEFSKNRNNFESLCSNFERTAVSIKRTSDISPNHLVPRGPLGPLMFPSC